MELNPGTHWVTRQELTAVNVDIGCNNLVSGICISSMTVTTNNDSIHKYMIGLPSISSRFKELTHELSWYGGCNAGDNGEEEMRLEIILES